MHGSEHPFLLQLTENMVLISQKINPGKVEFSYVQFGKIELEDEKGKRPGPQLGLFLSERRNRALEHSHSRCNAVSQSSLASLAFFSASFAFVFTAHYL